MALHRGHRHSGKRMKPRLRSLLCLLCALVLVASAAPAGHAKENAPVAKHIILIIGDGMQPENEIAASRYLTGKDDGLAFHAFPYRGFVATWDVTTYNRQVPRYGAEPYNPSVIAPRVGCDAVQSGETATTSRKNGSRYTCRTPEGAKRQGADSASTATAWATGYKTDTGNIAWLSGDPDRGATKTIAELLRENRGYAIGIVPTVPFSDATPAAQVSHNKSRRNYHAIAEEMIRTVQPDVVIGGGHPARNGAAYMSMALYDDVKNGRIGAYVFAERKDGMDAGKSLKEAAARAVVQKKKLFGLFGGPDGNFEPPIPTNDGTAAVTRATIENPLLKEATLAALKVLSKDKNGFFLMVEQGDIDWANHANDYKWMIGAMWDLDEAVKAAIDFVGQPGDDITWENTLLIVTSDHITGAMRLNDDKRMGKGRLPGQSPGLCPDKLAWCPGYPGGEVSYAATGHINDPVSLYAKGDASLTKHLRQFEGNWYPCTPVMDNTQLFHAMTNAAGIPQHSPLKAIVTRPTACPAGQ
jgi:alkaline phosphatase